MRRSPERQGKRSPLAYATVLAVLGGCAQIAGLRDRVLEDAGPPTTDGAVVDAPVRDATDGGAPDAADSTLDGAPDTTPPRPDAPGNDAPTIDAPASDAADAVADTSADGPVPNPVWTLAPSPTAATTFYAISGSGPSDAWIVGTGVLLQWAGSQWLNVTEAVTAQAWRGVWSVGYEDIWIVGTNVGGELVGGNYTPTAGAPALACVWAQSSIVYAGSSSGVFTAEGSLWQQAPGPGGNILAMGGRAGSEVWAAGDALSVLGPNGWISEADLTGPFAAVTSVTPGVAFVAGPAGSGNNVNRISDPGYTGNPSQTGVPFTGVNFNAIWANASSDVWAVGDVGAIAHFDGTSWMLVPPLTTSSLRGVWGSSANDVWAVGDNGVILHYH